MTLETLPGVEAVAGLDAYADGWTVLHRHTNRGMDSHESGYFTERRAQEAARKLQERYPFYEVRVWHKWPTGPRQWRIQYRKQEGY